MLKPLQRAAVAGGALFMIGSGALAQAPAGCGADLKGAESAESARYVVVYRAKPAPIAVSQHFALEIAVCAKQGAPAPDALAVDARMPEHGHGMNYKAAVRSLGSGRFQADGLMFHMPGRWQFAFDLRSGGNSERALRDYTLR